MMSDLKTDNATRDKILAKFDLAKTPEEFEQWFRYMVGSYLRSILQSQYMETHEISPEQILDTLFVEGRISSVEKRRPTSTSFEYLITSDRWKGKLPILLEF